jgi:DNA polymerase III subunit gamma/tau
MSESFLFETNDAAAPTRLALARKWRPRDFQSLIGQDHVVQALSHALDQNRLHHAWLFTGTRGVGKTTISRILAKSLNCTGTAEHPVTQPTSAPCGTCDACREIDAGRFVDYVEMDAASNRGIGDMIALLEKAVYGPTSGRFKVFMIDEVHMLTNQAFNSMLKTLEEPPPHMKFILATTDPQKIPVTILSRCLQFNLKQMPSSLIVNHLKTILQSEQLPVHEPALRIIAKSARGSMRDALSLTDQAIAFSSGQITEVAVRNMLGSLDDRYLIRMVDALAARDGQELLAITQEMALMSASFQMALQDLASLLQKIAMAQHIPESVLEEWPEADDVKRLAQALAKEEVQLFYQIAITSRADLTLAPEEETGFMMALLRMMAFIPDDGSGAAQRPVSKPAATARASTPNITGHATKATQASQVSSSPVPGMSATTVAEEKPVSPPSTEQIQLATESWRDLVKQLNLKGLVGQFALQTELFSYQEKAGALHIKLFTNLPQLATTSSLQQLSEHLEAYLKMPIKIHLDTNEHANTVAKIEAKDQAIAQVDLEQKVAIDPFLEQLKKEIGVTVVEGSIRPLPSQKH